LALASRAGRGARGLRVAGARPRPAWSGGRAAGLGCGASRLLGRGGLRGSGRFWGVGCRGLAGLRGLGL
jgi:hypothetical protein